MEGVDFGATIDDTHNPSAYRGGSLALLAAPIAVRGFLEGSGALKEKIFDGASLGAWIIKADDDASADTLRREVRAFLRVDPTTFAKVSSAVASALKPLNSAEAAWPRLSFVVDVAAVTPTQRVEPEFLALKRAEAKNHERQLREANWSPPSFDERARGAHERFDRVRPALPDCKVDAQGLKDQAVSPSFKARFEYGRHERQNFYKREAGASKAKGLEFAESFEEIIKEAPEGLSASISGKIAVFYADGNKFTKIREKSQSIAELRDFSEKLLHSQRGMLGQLLDWLRAGGASQNWEAYLQNPRSKGKAGPFWPLRFETLLWGGDELTFVMPAWLGIEFARKFCEWTGGWERAGKPLTFGMGLVFCHEKTPIRQVRKVAKEGLAEGAKSVLEDGKLENVLQIEAFESIALPEYENGLARYRAKLFDLRNDFDKETLAGALTLRGEGIANAIADIATLKDGAFPRSQIYNLLRIAKIGKEDKGNHAFCLDRGKADKDLAAEAQKYFKRMNRDVDEGLDAIRVLGKEVPLAYSLAVISGLWDYVEPLARVPAKPAVGQRI